MKSLSKLYLLAWLSLLVSPAFAQVTVSVKDAYVRGMPPGVNNTAAYMTLQNNSEQTLELTGAVSPLATSVMLHGTMNHNGMLHMQHVQSASIPAHGELVLASGGLHLMLMELKRQPQPGEEVELTLQFADGSEQTVHLLVRSVLDE